MTRRCTECGKNYYGRIASSVTCSIKCGKARNARRTEFRNLQKLKYGDNNG